MEDSKIIELYWARKKSAITETASKYGGLCRSIAFNILGSPEDSEECVNDTWLGAWNTIPPPRPVRLSAYLGKITRSLSFDRWRAGRTAKRGGGETALVLEELAECVSGRETAEDSFTRHELISAINGFLSSLPQTKRDLFLLRYWYVRPVGELAERFGMTPDNVSVTLSRLRRKLRDDLTKRGFDL